MRRLTITMVALAAGCVLCGPLVAAGSGESPGAAPGVPAQPVTLTLFDKNCSQPFTNPVALEITRRTGVFIEIQSPTGNPDEKLNLMLASGDLPDIVDIDRRSTNLNRYIAAGALVSLDDLVTRYGSNITAMYGDVLKKARYQDGHNYYLNNWYGVDPDPGNGVDMRLDVLKEFGYAERAAAGGSFTQEEFANLLASYQQKHPDVNGRPSIALSSKNYPNFLPTIMDVFKGMYGMKTYYEQDGKLSLLVKDPRYLEMVQFLNALNRKGLLDPEWATPDTDVFTGKAVSGRIFAFAGGMTARENDLLKKEFGSATDEQFFLFKVVAPGVDPAKTTYGARSSQGWDAIGITTANKNPTKTMEFLNFLASEAGQYLMLWGIEGKQWDLVGGKHTPRAGTPFGWGAGWSEYQQATGVRSWTWLIKNGYGSDGTPYDLIRQYKRDTVTEHAVRSMAGSTWDTAPYDNLGPAAGTPEALSEQRLLDITMKGFPEMVNAPSSEAVKQIYDGMVRDLNANGAAAIEAIYSKNYGERVKLWR